MEWEYTVITLGAQGFWGGKVDITELEAVMNNLGCDEWELTAALATNEGSGRARDVVVLFKRPRR